MSLTGSIGKKSKIKGDITHVDKFNSGSDLTAVVRLKIKLENSLQYKEGQFAYIDFHDCEALHPFSILNYDEDTKLVEFGIKDLGDYTHKLVNEINTRTKVTVEGGYGYFQMSSDANQVWIGAGIGIVPLLSRLYWLQKTSNKAQNKIEKIHLFYCVNNENEAFFNAEIKEILCCMDFIESEKGNRLTAEQVLKKIDSEVYSVSFCGPEGFGVSLKNALVKKGLSENASHKEIFKMR